jgi:uncharacterized protein with gpF-like domain
MARRLIKGGKRQEQRRQVALLDAIERRYQGRIRSAIRDWSMQALDVWEETGAVPQANQHESDMREIVQDISETAIRVFGERILDQQKAGAFVIERKDFATTLARMSQRYIMLEAVRERITDISDTTRAQIIRGIDRGVAEGLGVAQIASFVRDLVPGLSRYRSALIARTEAHGAANYGADAAAKDTGLVLMKEWVAAADERTRPDHDNVSAVPIPMDSLFQVGTDMLAYPGDPNGSPEQVINCRCAVAHIVVD